MRETSRAADKKPSDNNIQTMRKYEISCTIIIQALSQLKAMYKDDWEVLVGNCDSLLFLGGSDATTLEYVSKKLGKETIRSVNNSRSYGKQGSHSMSYNKTGRELMTPDELSNMDNENCVLFIRGLHPFFCTKYPLEKHPNYHLSGDSDKKREFDVKQRLHTGAVEEPPEKKRATRIYTEAQRSDTREADRQHRRSTRPVQHHSARNRELHQIKPLTEEFPGINLPPEARSPEIQAQLQASLENLEFMEMNQMSEEQAMQYQRDIAGMYFDMPPIDSFDESSIGADEERSET